MTEWRTLVDKERAAAFGVDRELHAVFFHHSADVGGSLPTVAIQIPETPRQLWRSALRLAADQKSRVFILCDTREQADRMADAAAKILTAHRRVPFERAESGQWGKMQ